MVAFSFQKFLFTIVGFSTSVDLASATGSLWYDSLGLVDQQFGTPGLTMFKNGTINFPPLWLDDRRRLQGRMTIPAKGWTVPLRWGPSPNHGGPTSIGVFTDQDIKKGTLIRVSAIDANNKLYNPAGPVFLRLTSYADLVRFCRLDDPTASHAEQLALRKYISDYIFLAKPPHGTPPHSSTTSDDEKVYGVWVPGCADNDANPGEAFNVEDRLTPDGYMGMYATRDIKAGEVLLSDYDGAYGHPPKWVAKFAEEHLDGKVVFTGYNHKSAKNVEF